MSVHTVLSRLLDYPDPSTFAVDAARLPRGPARQAVARFVASLEGVTLDELEREYVETFDFDRHACLFLTFHTHGDRRQRGIELVRLKRRYAAAGLELVEGQLPDWLPAVLEFAALEPEAGTELLAELRAPVELVRRRLRRRGSRYALLLDAVDATLPRLTRAHLERVARLAAAEPPTELVGLEPGAAVPAGAGA